MAKAKTKKQTPKKSKTTAMRYPNKKNKKAGSGTAKTRKA